MLNKYLLIVFAACLPSLIVTDTQKILVKSRYPNADVWYRDLAAKYPEAQLGSIDFCISDHHHAGSDAIFWPESNLSIINQYYNSPSAPPKAVKMLQEDEYLILHEASHVQHGDTTKGGIALAAATSVSAGITAGIAAQACAGAISATAAVATGIIGNAAVAATILAYARHQEQQADAFANQTASANALQAGIEWHAKNDEELHIPEGASSAQKALIELSSDQTHPAPAARKASAQAALEQRFSTPIAHSTSPQEQPEILAGEL